MPQLTPQHFTEWAKRNPKRASAMQSDPHFQDWAKRNPNTFNKLFGQQEGSEQQPSMLQSASKLLRPIVGPSYQAAGGFINTAGLGIPGAIAERTFPKKALEYMKPHGAGEIIGRGVGDIGGFVAGPGALAERGVAIAFPALSKATGMVARMLSGGMKTAGGFGLESITHPKDIGKEAAKGGAIGALMPPLGAALNKFGQPAVKFAQRVLMGHIPQEEAEAVIKEPHKIGKEWLANKYKQASGLMERYVKPKVAGKVPVNLSEVSATVNTPDVNIPMMDGGSIQLKVNGEPTGNYVRMHPSEQKSYEEISDDLHFHQKSPTFNSAQNIISKIDRHLDSYYKAKERGEATSGVFKTTMSSFRANVLNAIKTQHPDAGTALDEMADYYKWKGRAGMYSGIKPQFFQAIGPKLMFIAGFGMRFPIAGGMAASGTVPAFWKGGMMGAEALGSMPEAAKSAASLELPELYKQLHEEAMKKAMHHGLSRGEE